MDNKKFIKTLFLLAIPIILQNLVGASVNLLDNVMIGNLGESQIAATGIANQYYLIFFNTANGFVMGAGVFISQYWGKKDLKSIHKFMGISLAFSVATAIIFAASGVIFADNIIGIFTQDPNIIALGKSYLSVVTLSYIFTTISLSFGIGLRGTEQTKIPMYASFTALIFNVILNYLLIFGKFGCPKLGIVGAGYATTTARFIEMSFILSYIYLLQKNIVAGNIKRLFAFNISIVRNFLKTATPIVVNDIMWTAGVAGYFAIYSRLGTNATATMQICGTVNSIFNIFGIGIAAAGSVLIGKHIGEEKIELAKKLAVKIAIVGFGFGVILGTFFYFIAPFVIYLFKISKETELNVINVLRIMAAILPLRFYGIVLIVGILRAGGDVMFAIITELIAVWGIGVPLSFIGTEFFDFSISIIYILTCLEEVFKSIVTTFRLLSGKWIKDII